MMILKENGFSSNSNSFRYSGGSRDDTSPVASTSNESRYMGERVDTLRKPAGSVAALKELVSGCLNYQLLDECNLFTELCCDALQCTVEGYNLVFQEQPSRPRGSSGKEAYAQVSTSVNECPSNFYMVHD